MAIRAGKLRHSIDIQAPSPGGFSAASWSNFATAVRASAEPLQGREFMSASGERAEVTTRFRIRHISGVTADMRVIFENRVYVLAAPPIDPDMRHHELHLMTRLLEGEEP